MVRLPEMHQRFQSHIQSTLSTADPPIKDINTFVGTFSINSPSPPSSLVHSPRLNPELSTPLELEPVPKVEPLTVENVLWANTVLAAGTAVGFVIYTGEETRAVMNTSHPETKTGLLDLEINRLAKVRDTNELQSVTILSAFRRFFALLRSPFRSLWLP